MKKALLLNFVLFLISTNLNAQYYLEHLDSWEQTITSNSKPPKAKHILAFKENPLLLVIEDVPTSDKRKPKRKNKKEIHEVPFEVHKEFVANYNHTLDSVYKFYPYNKDIKIVSQREFKELKKKRSYSYIRIIEDNYLSFGSTEKKKALFILPLSSETRNNSNNLEAEFKFLIQRMENYFKRMEQGSRMSRKLYDKCLKELNEKLKIEFPQKTLLIIEDLISDDLDRSQLGSYLDLKFEIVSKEKVDTMIMNNTPGYWYIKILPYQGYLSSSNSSFDNNKQQWNSSSNPTRFFTEGAHYIVDPIDGSAVFVNFMLGLKIDETALKTYNLNLKKSSLSLRSVAK